MSLTKVTYSMVDGAVVNVLDFGAVGDGIADDTAAIQAAIDYCKLKRTSVLNSQNGGQATLFFPQGFYVVSGTLNVDGVIGFRMMGAGIATTQIVFTSSSSNLFYYSSYIYCTIENITFMTGTVSFSGGLPAVTAPVVKDNVCFRFNGNGGGTDVKFENCAFRYWDKVFTTTDAAVNDDSHHHYTCAFLNNNIVWDNTNIQAVIWSFNDCKVYFNEDTVFKNPGASLSVRGGNFINPGDFFTATLASTGGNSAFSDIRFENYQNIDPTSSPRFLVLSGTHTGLVFERCSAFGGGTLAGKTSATLSGIFEVTLRDCDSITGTWDINVTTATDSITSLLTLENTALTVNQILSGGAGNRPANINCIDYPSSLLGRVNRYFRGATGSQVKPISAVPMVDAVAFGATVNASTVTKELPIFVLPPYSLVLKSVEFVVQNNTGANFDLVVWKDSTKAVKLCEILGMNANGVTKVFEANATVWPKFTSTSDPLFVEITSASNAGFVTGEISFSFSQAY